LLYLLYLVLMLGVATATGQSYFKGDTLTVQVNQFDQNAFDSMGYSFAPRMLQQVFKVNHEDNSRFADIDYDDSNWKTDSSFQIDNKYAINVIWYRFKLRIDSAMQGRSFVMLFDGEGALELYVDGSLKATIGTLPALGHTGVYHYLKASPVLLNFTDTAYHQVAIRFKSSIEQADGTPAWFRFRVDDTLNHFHQSKFGSMFSGMILVGLGALFFALFLVHSLFFLFYKKEKANLIFAIFAFSITLCLMSSYAYFNAATMRYDRFYISVVNFVPIISCFSLCAFISYVFSKSNKTLLVIIILCGLSLILAGLDAYSFFDLSVIFIWILLAGSLVYTIVMIVVAMFRKVPGSLILGSGVLYFLLFAFSLLGISIARGTINFDTTLSYLTLSAILGIPLSISAYLAWRFSTTSKALSKELNNVAALSLEKQQILEHQNEQLELQVSERTKELKMEKQKSDDLLLNILPQEVAEELKEKGASKAQYYDEVSVLFTDFVNFTAIAQQLGVEELLAELNTNFTAFDQIMEKHGLEKIKTIGDAYLAVSGLPVKNTDHALNAAAAALDILAFVAERKKQVPYGLDIRIGIHSGSLIAGIVGVKKFAFDIWGDTVNTAARMEQSSAPGKVNISESTYHLIEETFNCTYRGKLQAKGKGEMDMYFVENKK